MDPVEPSDSPVGSYEGMVDNLVTQFSSAMDCFRELVQNSIDAGTHRIEVWTEFLPGDGHTGTIAIHVDDFGEGMDEAIIDNEFTQLFASNKDEDLTKIGKFGIGFVSVFALQPRAVLVHTGRSGEYWEVLFHEDRSFSKTRVDNPVEGTQITLFLEDEYHRYQELTEQIPATLRHWCNHSTVEITFEDRSGNEEFAPPTVINEDFEVDGVCMQHIELEGTEMVVAYSERPIYGFYNRGLTLALTDVGDDVLSRWQSRFEFISFKIKSRYLEHTLARDSVIQDEQYERAMNLLEDAANNTLLKALIESLEDLASQPSWTVDQYHRYARLMAFLASEPVEQILPHRDRDILRCVNGPSMSLSDVWDRLRNHGRLFVSHEPTPLTRTLASQDIPVLLGIPPRRHLVGDELRAVSTLIINILSRKSSSTARGLLWSAVDQVRQLFGDDGDRPIERRIGRSIVDPESVYFSIAIDDDPPADLVPLLDETLTLLTRAGTGIEYLTTGVIEAPGDDVPLFVVADEIGALTSRRDDPLREHGEAYSSSEDQLISLMMTPVRQSRKLDTQFQAAVNRNHPQFDTIVATYERDPALGTYLLARGLSLSQDYRLDAHNLLLDASLPDIRRQYSSHLG